jgi:hypothetical protein
MLIALTLAAPSAAQKQEVFIDFGSQAFSNMLDAEKLEPIPRIEDLKNHDPKETLIVVFGDTSILDKIRDQTGNLKTFYDNGGALLIASERFTALNEFDLYISGESMIAFGQQSAFHGIAECPLTEQMDLTHPIFQGVSNPLATNQPSEIFLRDTSNVLQPLSGLAALKNLGIPPGVPVGPGFHYQRCFIAGTAPSSRRQGQVLVVANKSVFLNLLVVLPSVDNGLFARNTVEWLTDGGKRKYCLFVEEGKIQTKFDRSYVQPPSLPLPGEERINNLLRGLENENFFNKLLLHWIPKNTIVQYLFVGLSLVVFARLLYRGFAGRYARETGLPLAARMLEVTTSTQPLLAQRHDVLARGQNLLEIARDEVRRWLAVHGLDTGTRTPRAEVDGWWERRGWQRRLNDLWQLASGPARARVNPRRYRALLRTMQELNEAVRQGTVRLKPD